MQIDYAKIDKTIALRVDKFDEIQDMFGFRGGKCFGEIPRYSMEWVHAMHALEALRYTDEFCCIRIHSDYSYVWTVELVKSGSERHVPCARIDGFESGPLSVCLAILVALGHKEEEFLLEDD